MPLWLLVLLFLAAAVVVWFAGIRLSTTTAVLDQRWHLGNALGGLIVLAVATNLPEIAITVSAAVSGELEVAVGNILGGIALQTVVLVALDAFGRRGKGVAPLTTRAASLVLVIEALVVVAVLAVVIAGSRLPGSVALGGITPEGVMILALWVIGLLLVKRASKGLPWKREDDAPAPADPHSSGSSHSKTHQQPTWRVVVTFSIAALLTLGAGVVLEQAGSAAADQIGLSGVLFGATVLAASTSLPELSTGLQAVKQGDDRLAFGDIFGGNAFLPVLFLVAGVISGQAVLPRAEPADVYLTALAALLTVVYAVGLLFRSRRRFLGMGVDSLVVLLLYLLGIGGLFAISG